MLLMRRNSTSKTETSLVQTNSLRLLQRLLNVIGSNEAESRNKEGLGPFYFRNNGKGSRVPYTNKRRTPMVNNIGCRGLPFVGNHAKITGNHTCVAEASGENVLVGLPVAAEAGTDGTGALWREGLLATFMRDFAIA
jgi:hypothetical protein